MKAYKLQWESATVGLPWEYDFHTASDRMAIEYAERHAVRITDQGFMALLVWSLGDNPKLIARFVRENHKVRNTQPLEESV